MTSVMRAAVVAGMLSWSACGAAGEPGEPLAVRWWGEAFVTIETFGGLTVAIDPYAETIGYGNPGVQADLVLITHNHPGHNNPGLVRGIPGVELGLDRDGRVRDLDVVLHRPAGEARPSWGKSAGIPAPAPGHVRARTIGSDHDAEGGAARGKNAMWMVEVDGVRVLHCGDLGQRTLSAEQLGSVGEVDVLLIAVGGVFTVDGPGAAAVCEQLRPRFVVPIHYKTAAVRADTAGVEGFLEALPARYQRAGATGNTLAVCAGRGPTRESPRVVVLDYLPWVMPGALEELVLAKERSAREAADVFAPLSVEQVSFRPANGTHTPRWNAEHMAGRELGFFSAVYNRLDDSVPVMDRNPRQMPDQYEARHPGWSGAEEARHIEHVQAFTRRFAYLLDGVEPDATLAGVPRFVSTARRLLGVMEGHYREHSANVRKKFELPDWPGK